MKRALRQLRTKAVDSVFAILGDPDLPLVQGDGRRAALLGITRGCLYLIFFVLAWSAFSIFFQFALYHYGYSPHPYVGDRRSSYTADAAGFVPAFTCLLLLFRILSRLEKYRSPVNLCPRP